MTVLIKLFFGVAFVRAKVDLFKSLEKCTNELWQYQNAMYEVNGENILKISLKRKKKKAFYVTEYTNLMTNEYNYIDSPGLEIEWNYLDKRNSSHADCADIICPYSKCYRIVNAIVDKENNKIKFLDVPQKIPKEKVKLEEHIQCYLLRETKSCDLLPSRNINFVQIKETKYTKLGRPFRQVDHFDFVKSGESLIQINFPVYNSQ